MKNIIIADGARFSGSQVVRLFECKHSEYGIFNVAVQTHAGNLENLSDIESVPNYVFERVHVVDAAAPQLEQIAPPFVQSGYGNYLLKLLVEWAHLE